MTPLAARLFSHQQEGQAGRHPGTKRIGGRRRACSHHGTCTPLGAAQTDSKYIGDSSTSQPFGFNTMRQSGRSSVHLSSSDRSRMLLGTSQEWVGWLFWNGRSSPWVWALLPLHAWAGPLLPLLWLGQQPQQEPPRLRLRHPLTPRAGGAPGRSVRLQPQQPSLPWALTPTPEQPGARGVHRMGLCRLSKSYPHCWSPSKLPVGPSPLPARSGRGPEGSILDSLHRSSEPRYKARQDEHGR